MAFKLSKLKFWGKEKGEIFPLHVKDLYGGPRNLIKGVTFKVRKRDIFAIVGLSGSGKTTLMKLVLGMYRKKSGNVNFFGKKIFWSKKAIGFCPQNHSFLKSLQ